MESIKWKVRPDLRLNPNKNTMSPESAYRYEIISNTHGQQTAQMKRSPIVWGTKVIVLTKVTELLYINKN